MAEWLNIGAAIALFIICITAGFALARWIHHASKRAISLILINSPTPSGNTSTDDRAAWRGWYSQA